MDIEVTDRFVKQYRKLPQRIQKKAKQQEIIFRANPFDARLKTHKLTGQEKEHWSFSINYSYRIKFVFSNEYTVLFIDIGTHEIYK
ncbi:MAG: type II toxin-antitoxin system mRNA interferase toxin, RelE/StbE family [Patescibacteria group bacterium]|jgi:mRNA-degrading endonuclease YafQ of YafQ-DinJ toxin-antitoxin module